VVERSRIVVNQLRRLRCGPPLDLREKAALTTAAIWGAVWLSTQTSEPGKRSGDKAYSRYGTRLLPKRLLHALIANEGAIP
jgi:hypothetical protein